MIQLHRPTEGVADLAVKELKGNLRGDYLLPKEEGYEDARKVWNGMIDRRPAIIVRCQGASDVIKAVGFGRKHGLTVSVRGGGHNVAGNAVNDGGIVIDLSRMKGVRVDPVARTAMVEPGAVWHDFDTEAQVFGLATTGGLISTTGGAGFSLGGGIGWLVRKHGLALDNLISVDLVTADGELVTASADQNSDLFWGVRGGGGNFGVVTSFEFQLHAVGPTVVGGMVLHKASEAEALLKFYRDYVKDVPDELTTLVAFLTAPPLPFIPKELVGKHMVAVAGCYSGPIDEGMKVLDPLKRFGNPVADLLGPIPYIALQSFLDMTAPFGSRNYWKTSFLKGLDDGFINTYLDFGERVPSPMTSVHIHHLGGAMGRVNEGSTAFSNRDAAFAMNIVSEWQSPDEDEPNIRWTKALFDAVQQFSTGAAYLNFLGEEGQDRVRAAYGEEKYRKLSELKGKYDPTNFFKMNQNIKPPK
jgi:hypothetical protein